MSPIGWALLAPEGDHPGAWIAQSQRPVTTIVRDPRAGLALVASGMVPGLLVAYWRQLDDVVERVEVGRGRPERLW